MDNQITLEELFKRHPLPWEHHVLMITDANRRQVLHLGGTVAEYGRQESGEKLTALNALLVESANRHHKP